ncbi:MAG: 50S ribosomal protein L11 methyltransferase [Firmicutes bacterium]|nr:50S ribosomal protein L11 methyltransferase [Bacillota bacterium]
MDLTLIKLYIEEDRLDMLLAALEDYPHAGLSVEDPRDVRDLMDKKNSYDWDYIDTEIENMANGPGCITVYVEDSLEGMDLMEDILYEASAQGVDRVEVSALKEDDWKDNWKQYFKPLRITERLTVKPSWETYEPASPEEKIIEIDPGQAFGTGGHATTTLCMRLMEKYMDTFADKPSVLDVGCGSGILSIAAAFLGASSVTGVELDPAALEVARENAALNGLDGKIDLVHGDLTEGLDLKADLVAANLMADLVIRLSEHVSGCMNPGGIYISSGILTEKRPQVAAAVEAAGFEILESPEEGEWCAIAARWKGEN